MRAGEDGGGRKVASSVRKGGRRSAVAAVRCREDGRGGLSRASAFRCPDVEGLGGRMGPFEDDEGMGRGACDDLAECIEELGLVAERSPWALRLAGEQDDTCLAMRRHGRSQRHKASTHAAQGPGTQWFEAPKGRRDEGEETVSVSDAIIRR